MKQEFGVQGKIGLADSSCPTQTQDMRSRRKFALAVLHQLHQDFAAMGKSRQAKPLLHALTALAEDSEQRTELAG